MSGYRIITKYDHYVIVDSDGEFVMSASTLEEANEAILELENEIYDEDWEG